MEDNFMIEESLQRIKYLCNTFPELLKKITEEEFSYKPSPEKWSKKEILGHLIDSATNNHQRFIRVQFENVPVITYNQNQWNTCNNYNHMSASHLISFWLSYNIHLFEVIKQIPAENLSRECSIGKTENVTLEWLIIDYVRHLEHHLKQIVEFK
jgi:hypothetical protein